MTVHKLTQTINRPAADVFATVSNLETFPKWNPTTKAANKTSDGPIGNGTRFAMSIRGFGDTVQELQEFKAGKQVRLVPIDRRVAGGHRFILHAEGKATRVEHELEMKPLGFFRLMAPMMNGMARKNLQKTADSLKAYLET
jgi:uncharacterized protein YndB with AHSA1/START domain